MVFIKSKINYEHSGYFFIALFGLAILGFWPSYFSRFFDGTADFTFYIHFHTVIATLWIFALIVQPILIRKRKLQQHKLIGKLSYALFPLIFISVALLAHSRITGTEDNLGMSLWIPFKDLLILGVAYFIAIKYRHSIDIHARGMIVGGIVLIEPALIRLIMNLSAGTEIAAIGYPITIAIIYSLLIGLIIMERHQKQGRWVFPMTLGLYLFVHSVIIFQIHIGPWQTFAKWFAALPIT